MPHALCVKAGECQLLRLGRYCGTGTAHGRRSCVRTYSSVAITSARDRHDAVYSRVQPCTASPQRTATCPSGERHPLQGSDRQPPGRPAPCSRTLPAQFCTPTHPTCSSLFCFGLAANWATQDPRAAPVDPTCDDGEGAAAQQECGRHGQRVPDVCGEEDAGFRDREGAAGQGEDVGLVACRRGAVRWRATLQYRGGVSRAVWHSAVAVCSRVPRQGPG